MNLMKYTVKFKTDAKSCHEHEDNESLIYNWDADKNTEKEEKNTEWPVHEDKITTVTIQVTECSKIVFWLKN